MCVRWFDGCLFMWGCFFFPLLRSSIINRTAKPRGCQSEPFENLTFDSLFEQERVGVSKGAMVDPNATRFPTPRLAASLCPKESACCRVLFAVSYRECVNIVRRCRVLPQNQSEPPDTRAPPSVCYQQNPSAAFSSFNNVARAYASGSAVDFV